MGVLDIQVRAYELAYPPGETVVVTDPLSGETTDVAPEYFMEEPPAPNAWYRFVTEGVGTIAGAPYESGLYNEPAGPAHKVQYTVTTDPLKFFAVLPDVFTSVVAAEIVNQTTTFSDPDHDVMIVREGGVIKINDMVTEASPAVVASAGDTVNIELTAGESVALFKVAVPTEG